VGLDAVKEAKAGDVLVELRCRCAGAVLVREYAVADWTCNKGHQAEQVGPRFRLDGQLHAVLVETCTDRRAVMDVDGWGYSDCTLDAEHPGEHHPGPIVHDAGAFRAMQVPA
jgi:hypothetical protein